MLSCLYSYVKTPIYIHNFIEIKYSETSEQWTPIGLKKIVCYREVPLLGGNLQKIVTFETKRFVRYSWHVRYWDVRYWEVSLYLVI